MKKVKLGIYLEEDEYRQRFTCYFMNHYKDQIEIYIYTDMEQLLQAAGGTIDVALAEETDCWNREDIPLVQLVDETPLQTEEGVFYVEKYQEINKIVDEILKHVGSEVKNLHNEGSINGSTRVIGKYSLADNQYQLPFAMTLGSIMGEEAKVLVIDFQENSGLSKVLESQDGHNLEEILTMAESGRFSANRINACITHLEKVDYVYPISNTECLCDIDTVICNNLMQIVCQELQYDVVIISMGARFKGFFDILNRCAEIFVVQRKGGIGQWREYEFTEELMTRGYKEVLERIRIIEPPIVTSTVNTCERLAEQWKWNEFGDIIRSLVKGVSCAG